MPLVELSELVRAASRLQVQWESEGLPFCFIGGLAVQRWGEPRFTRDVDASIFFGIGGEQKEIDRQLQYFRPRLPDAVQFALINRVLLVEDAFGCPFDLSLAAMPFEKDCIDRATNECLVADISSIRICRPGDLIVMKVFAGRAQDWHDICSNGILDWPLVFNELNFLMELKEEPEAVERLRRLKAELAID
jgi:hypothetical protein